MAPSSPLLMYISAGNPLRSTLNSLMFVYIFASELNEGLQLHKYERGKR